jgi:hypothetical protein
VRAALDWRGSQMTPRWGTAGGVFRMASKHRPSTVRLSPDGV